MTPGTLPGIFGYYNDIYDRSYGKHIKLNNNMLFWCKPEDCSYTSATGVLTGLKYYYKFNL